MEILDLHDDTYKHADHCLSQELFKWVFKQCSIYPLRRIIFNIAKKDLNFILLTA